MKRYQVLDNRLITPSVRLLTLRVRKGETPLLHQPGQYAAISLHDRARPTTNRCFSLTSSSLSQQTIQFSIRIGGKFTSALERLRVGDSVCVRGPFGGFVFDEYEHKDLVMLAGGIGIAPFISMIRYATKMNLKNKLHLVYSIKTQNDIAFLDELTKLQSANKNLKISYIVGEGNTDKLPHLDVLHGRLDATKIKHLELDLAHQTYMMCGPPAYMNALQAILERHGVAKSRILSEAFSQNHGNQTGKLKSWPFSMYALTGFSFLAIGFFIVASDLYRTLPKLEIDNLTTPSQSNNVISTSGDLQVKINSLPPQVSTDISQKPNIKKNTAAPNYIPQATVKTAPVIKPKPTVAQQAPVTKTRVS